MHPRIMQHLEIDLIGVQEAEKRPEAEEDRPLQPIDPDLRRLARVRAISYLDSIFHLFNYTLTLPPGLKIE